MSQSSQVVRVILLVSCAHALVHLLEQSVASVEQVISADFQLTIEQSGFMGFALRLPYGIGAFFAGLLADRFGEKRILVLYLLGSAVVAASFMVTSTSSVLYAQMFSMGAFASMYHPAGLALLANQTTPAERSRALGLHGVFGSLGIASAPFLAGFMLSLRPGDWRGYYLLLSIISGSLGFLVWGLLKPVRHDDKATLGMAKSADASSEPASQARPSMPFQIWPYVLLVIGTALSGVVYGGVLHFLPRYLKEAGAMGWLETFVGHSISEAALGNYAAALALVCGAFGQWTAGRLAKPAKLPMMLSLVYAANVPFLLWMTFAEGGQRLLAACLWAFIHFMNQPLYNSLLPEFLPSRRRSVGFGFSNMMGFGVGAVGPPLVAQFDERFADYTYSYSALAVLALIAALLPLPLLFAGFAKREHQGD
ncbi:MFS transporter [Fuerstiella marisgermanici]|uniref:MFS transporter n=1 Tax=Fuerstiella marisgermanici TaxID=1891926 RepID=UPI0013142E9D|nr:MFS transporter [Fuerstiella marisgermanici]